MKYLIIGAGGTGGCLGAYMKMHNKDVAVIARNDNLKAIRKDGLILEMPDGKINAVKIDAFDMEEYDDCPDVIFVCVKSYDIDGCIDFIKRVSDKNTVVIPLLNIYSTGEYLSEKLPNLLVTDGCIYISSNLTGAGKLKMHGDIFRIYFGVRNLTDKREILDVVEKDLTECGISAVNSKEIKKDALEKYSFVSAMAACGIYHDCCADKMQADGEIRNDFIELVNEIFILAGFLKIEFQSDLLEKNLKILDDLSGTASTSMQRDIKAGKSSEIDVLIHSVARISRENNLNLYLYETISDKFI